MSAVWRKQDRDRQRNHIIAYCGELCEWGVGKSAILILADVGATTEKCKIMLVEPAGTGNSSVTGGDMTAENNVWI